jgi:hypothetical protein
MSEFNSAEERVAASRAAMPELHYNHVRFSPSGTIDSIICKSCSAPIAGTIVSDEPPHQIVINGKKQFAVQTTFARFDNYQEACILFADGSNHITHLCKLCLAKFLAISDPEERTRVAEAVYCADLVVWMEELKRVSGKIHPHNFKRQVVDIRGD